VEGGGRQVKVHTTNGREKPTASVLLADGFPLMAGPNFQPSDGNPTVISILRQLADGPKNVPEMYPIHLVSYRIFAGISIQILANTREMITDTMRVMS
jgi:hypothetical protein